MSSIKSEKNSALYCKLDAIPPEKQEAHLANARRLLQEDYLALKELPDGYAFQFTAEKYEMIAEYIALERLCCGFFTFALKITPHQGPIWLHIHGNEQIKAFLKHNLQGRDNQDGGLS